MIEGILSGEKRRGQGIIPFTDKYPQERILRHRAAQCFRHVHVAVFVWLVVPRPHTPGQIFVKEIALEFQIAADIVVKCRGIWANNRCQAWIVFWPRPSRILVDAGKAAVESAYGTTLIAQQLLVKTLNLNAQVA